MPANVTRARYEASTRTIRSVPGNHWLASMDSWDGAINHEEMAHVFAAAPAMKKALEDLSAWCEALAVVGSPTPEAWALLAKLQEAADLALAQAKRGETE